MTPIVAAPGPLPALAPNAPSPLRVNPAGELLVADDWLDAVAVTPSDSADLPGGICRALYVGGSGALVVVTVAGSTTTFAAVPAGTTLRLRCSRVRSTGTTASSIVATY